MYFSFFVLLFFFGVNLTIGQVIEECLSRYEPSEVCVSFNGGKDCSALLHLIHAAWIRRRSSSVSTDRLRLRALYIRGQDPFPEMEQFIEDTRQRQLFFRFCFLYHRIYFYIIPSTLSRLSSRSFSHQTILAIFFLSFFLCRLRCWRQRHSHSLSLSLSSIPSFLSVSYSNWSNPLREDSPYRFSRESTISLPLCVEREHTHIHTISLSLVQEWLSHNHKNLGKEESRERVKQAEHRWIKQKWKAKKGCRSKTGHWRQRKGQN